MNSVRSFAKVFKPIDKANINKINKLPLKEYFEDLMRRRQLMVGVIQNPWEVRTKKGNFPPKPLNDLGYINLPQQNFVSMVERITVPEDVGTLKDAYYNYLGHRNILPQNIIDKLMLKALEIGEAGQMLDFVKYHSELLYHPSQKVLEEYTTTFEAAGYDQLKAWFGATKGRYLLVRPAGFHNLIIKAASENGDKKTVIDAYLDVLDYSWLDDSAVEKTAEAVSYVEAVDHVLVGHLKEQMDARNLNSKMFMAVYYFNVQGGLTACDLLGELIGKDLPNSEQFKSEFVDKVFSDAHPCDSFVRDKLKAAILLLKLDFAFYGIQPPAQPQQEATPLPELEASPVETAQPESPVL